MDGIKISGTRSDLSKETRKEKSTGRVVLSSFRNDMDSAAMQGGAYDDREHDRNTQVLSGLNENTALYQTPPVQCFGKPSDAENDNAAVKKDGGVRPQVAESVQEASAANAGMASDAVVNPILSLENASKLVEIQKFLQGELDTNGGSSVYMNVLHALNTFLHEKNNVKEHSQQLLLNAIYATDAYIANRDKRSYVHAYGMERIKKMRELSQILEDEKNRISEIEDSRKSTAEYMNISAATRILYRRFDSNKASGAFKDVMRAAEAYQFNPTEENKNSLTNLVDAYNGGKGSSKDGDSRNTIEKFGELIKGESDAVLKEKDADGGDYFNGADKAFKENGFNDDQSLDTQLLSYFQLQMARGTKGGTQENDTNDYFDAIGFEGLEQQYDNSRIYGLISATDMNDAQKIERRTLGRKIGVLLQNKKAKYESMIDNYGNSMPEDLLSRFKVSKEKEVRRNYGIIKADNSMEAEEYQACLKIWKEYKGEDYSGNEEIPSADQARNTLNLPNEAGAVGAETHTKKIHQMFTGAFHDKKYARKNWKSLAADRSNQIQALKDQLQEEGTSEVVQSAPNEHEHRSTYDISHNKELEWRDVNTQLMRRTAKLQQRQTMDRVRRDKIQFYELQNELNKLNVMQFEGKGNKTELTEKIKQIHVILSERKKIMEADQAEAQKIRTSVSKIDLVDLALTEEDKGEDESFAAASEFGIGWHGSENIDVDEIRADNHLDEYIFNYSSKTKGDAFASVASDSKRNEAKYQLDDLGNALKTAAYMNKIPGIDTVLDALKAYQEKSGNHEMELLKKEIIGFLSNGKKTEGSVKTLLENILTAALNDQERLLTPEDGDTFSSLEYMEIMKAMNPLYSGGNEEFRKVRDTFVRYRMALKKENSSNAQTRKKELLQITKDYIKNHFAAAKGEDVDRLRLVEVIQDEMQTTESGGAQEGIKSVQKAFYQENDEESVNEMRQEGNNTLNQNFVTEYKDMKDDYYDNLGENYIRNTEFGENNVAGSSQSEIYGRNSDQQYRVHNMIYFKKLLGRIAQLEAGFASCAASIAARHNIHKNLAKLSIEKDREISGKIEEEMRNTVGANMYEELKVAYLMKETMMMENPFLAGMNRLWETKVIATDRKLKKNRTIVLRIMPYVGNVTMVI